MRARRADGGGRHHVKVADFVVRLAMWSIPVDR